MTDDSEDPILTRFRRMSRPARLVYARPRAFLALALGIVVCLLLPSSLRPVTRFVLSWDSLVAVYLAMVFGMMLRHQHQHIARRAAMQDDGRAIMLMVVALGAFASIAAIVIELDSTHRGGAELAMAIVTLALSWAAVNTAYALHYAHDYYRSPTPGGLHFPGDTDHPDYWDFVYFSFVLGMTSQVTDVSITDRAIRRTVTVHAIVAFIYNAALLALTINIVASAITPAP
ncbi:MAG: DUF1345 domain-containing protein [Alphaproteobacteria bacterium]|nr:DUF1345 domain-containing protein [Alphaproteobacteria bacterium]